MSPRISRFIMGCVGSKQEDRRKKEEDVQTYEQSNCTNNTTGNNSDSQQQRETTDDDRTPEHLQPKVSMMSDHTLKLLQEIGELKSFTEVDPSEINLNKFSDFIMALENPQAATNNAKTRST